MMALQRADGKGYKWVVFTPSPNTNFDPNFIHKRHWCDGCHQDPIVGSRYHAIPNIDLCQLCFDTALTLRPDDGGDDEGEERKPSAAAAIVQSDEETIIFEMTQHRSDQGILHSKFAHMLSRVRQGLKNVTATQRQKANNTGETKPGYKDTALEGSTRVSDFDVAMAIQKSVQDLTKQGEEMPNHECRDDDI